MTALATLKAFAKTHLPRGMNVGPAVVQLFLNDGRRTRLGLNNFPAFFAPTRAVEYRYRVRIFDEEGRDAGRAVVALARYGAADVGLNSLFGAALPRYGIVAARIEP